MTTAEKTRLTETTYSADLRVDEEKGVIFGVKVLGRESANGRTYEDAAMDQAAKLYEGTDVNIDHPSKATPDADRTLVEGFGVLENVRRKGDAVFADLPYLKTHPLAEMVVERAKRMPQKFGLSHNAEGTVRMDGGRQIVEGIEDVRSVDLVRNPATNESLFESETPVKKKTLLEITKAKFPNTAVKVLREQEAAGLLDPTMEVAETANPVEAIKEALAEEAKKVFLDPAIPPKETGKQVAELAKAVEDVAAKLEGQKPEEEPATEETTPAATPESTRLKTDPKLTQLSEKVDKMERRETIRRVLAEGDISPDLLEPAKMSLLESAADEPTMKALIATWPAYTLPRLRTPKPLMETRHGSEDLDTPKNAEELARAVR